MVSTRRPQPGTRTVGAKGQITISAGARERLAIEAGTRLVEVVVGGVLVYVPADPAVIERQDAFADTLAAQSITAESLLADIEAGKEDVFNALYDPA